MSERTAAQWLRDGLCPRGHAIRHATQLYRRSTGGIECARCRTEMLAERASLRRAAAARKASGRD